MKKTLYLQLAVVFGLAVSCNKENLLYKQEEVKGRVVLENGFTEVPDVIAPESTIYLVDVARPTRFLYSTQAGKDGKFTLTYQPDKKDNINVVARYTDANGLLYEGYYPLNNLPPTDNQGEKELRLTPIYKKGILKVKVFDPTGTQAMVGATVFLFTNQIQAGTLGEATPQGIVSQTVTNAKGIAFFGTLEKGDYWIGAKLGGLLKEAKKISVDPALTPGTSSTTIHEALTLVSPQSYELIVTVVEKQTGTPMFGVPVYLFVNASQAGTYTDDKVLGAVLTGSSAPNGQVSFKPVDPGKTYYVGAVGTLTGGAKIKASQIVMTTTNPTSKTLELSP